MIKSKRNESLILENFRYWESKNLYVNLMKKFVKNEILATEFVEKFFEIWEFDRDRTSNIKDLSYITENFELAKLDKFSDLILIVFNDCEVFESDSLIREKYEIDENELKECVKKVLFGGRTLLINVSQLATT